MFTLNLKKTTRTHTRPHRHTRAHARIHACTRVHTYVCWDDWQNVALKWTRPGQRQNDTRLDTWRRMIEEDMNLVGQTRGWTDLASRELALKTVLGGGHLLMPDAPVRTTSGFVSFIKFSAGRLDTEIM